ncbi:FKBP-type peptidyl-prolyl cis-trans isomerase [Pedobacter sp.]|uniref:FKBP-type peptidyl-prolyl cis-trans isomerase n=1 Tax=Pedobacter sp. TaxID=1411316 RepID=UPI003D7F948B
MKKTFIALSLSFFAFGAMAQKKAATPVKATVKKQAIPVKAKVQTLTNGLDSASYAFGLMMATNLKTNELTTLNYDLMVKGLKDAFNNQTPMLDMDASQNAISSLFREAGKKKYAAALAEGAAFFEKNKKVPGVITTASGLQYQVLKAGSGEKATAADRVTVHYTGTLLNGTEFDNSYKRGEPTSFGVTGVITGWTEGLQLMQKGSKFKFFIPYELAYGERSPGPEIPAYSNLIFEIELISIAGK